MSYAKSVAQSISSRYPYQPEFIQSVQELTDSLSDFLDKHPLYEAHKILERLVEPERSISFRVAWVNDKGAIQVNRGYRVQFSSTLGPYKGGLRFHPSVNEGMIKFLSFEQVFKNSLTGFWLGGAKGGADFDPKGKSDQEVMRFCQAYMSELANYIGPDSDIPAGDIGVGIREIGYLFGWYKKLAGEFHGSMTGKGVDWGGSHLRPEATGYGLIYLTDAVLSHWGKQLSGRRVVVSGSGNVAMFTVEKAINMGAQVLTMSDSDGYIHDPGGITTEKLAFIKELKGVRRGRISEYTDEFKKSTYRAHQPPWQVAADIYLPCATQNEIDEAEAKIIISNKPLLVGEGANMPTTLPAIKLIQTAGILFIPSKAGNAGGVAVSALEMSQNTTKISRSPEDIDGQLKQIMQDIHDKCILYGANGKTLDYLRGANIAGFVRVADAMIEQGVI